MNSKTRKLIVLGLIVLGLAGILNSFPSQAGAQTAVQADGERKWTIRLDVACDCRTFSFNRRLRDDRRREAHARPLNVQ